VEAIETWADLGALFAQHATSSPTLEATLHLKAPVENHLAQVTRLFEDACARNAEPLEIAHYQRELDALRAALREQDHPIGRWVLVAPDTSSEWEVKKFQFSTIAARAATKAGLIQAGTEPNRAVEAWLHEILGKTPHVWMQHLITDVWTASRDLCDRLQTLETNRPKPTPAQLLRDCLASANMTREAVAAEIKLDLSQVARHLAGKAMSPASAIKYAVFFSQRLSLELKGDDFRTPRPRATRARKRTKMRPSAP